MNTDDFEDPTSLSSSLVFNPQASLVNPPTKRTLTEVTDIRNQILKSKNGTKYKFSSIGKKNTLYFSLIEDIEFCPFLYEKRFSLDDFKEHHPAFLSLKTLSEVNNHIYKLLENKKISIDIEENKICNVASINMKIKNISREEMTKPFELELKMTDYKDDYLISLYNKQKNQIKILKKIKNIVENKLQSENPISKEIFNELNQAGYELE